ncbi:MAG: NAD+ kinase [Alphaproteobacteria bacterium]|jgi:NAD+ kinase
MKIHFTAHHAKDNHERCTQLINIYGQSEVQNCDIIVAIGGDGFMLEMIHKALEYQKPIFGMKGGSLGFLMNSFDEHHKDTLLIKRIQTAVKQTLHPLRMTAINIHGETFKALAFNEVVLQRASRQAAKIKLYIDDVLRIEELVCDGVMLATPAGSTAYNFSVYGPILPIGANVLALTPISAFRPRRWRGAILPHKVSVRFEATQLEKRPVSLTADHLELDDIHIVEICEETSVTVTLLYDADHPLPERILSEQFNS